MKKLTKAVVMLLAAVIALAPIAAFAFAPVGNVDVPYGTPTIDGNLAQGEWSEKNKVHIDGNNATADGWTGDIPEGFCIDFYYTWDDANFYAAGVITDADFCYSDGLGSYNGDAFQISLNVGNVYTSAEYNRATFYSFGCTEEGLVDIMVQESDVNDGDIENCGFCSKTDTGWKFEFALPWATLVQHVADKADKQITVEPGLQIGALICYIDRDSTDGAVNNAFGTSAEEVLGWDPDAHGINLILIKNEAAAAPAEQPAAAEAPAEQPAVTEAPAVVIAPAAQTADLAVIAIVALGAAVIAKKH